MAIFVDWCRTTLLTDESPWRPHVELPEDPVPWVDAIIRTMGEGPLMPSCAPFVTTDHPPDVAAGLIRFSGNFDHVSGSFQVRTDDPETIERFSAAIRANMASPAYRDSVREYERRNNERRAREGARGTR